MTFATLVNATINKYKNKAVSYSILFDLSKKVKNINKFVEFRNDKIDFNYKIYLKKINDYFINSKPLDLINEYTIFLSNKFKIFPSVLCPRNETEQLCVLIINILKKNQKLKKGIDLFSGSGIIGISIKKYLEYTDMFLNDINRIAIKNEIFNRKINNVKLKIIQGDFYKVLLKNKYDFVIANPPYVKKNELDKSMLKYESKRNFLSKNNLFFYSKIINNYKKFINNLNNFLICFEINNLDKNNLQKIISKNKLDKQSIFIKDYNKKNRFLFISGKKIVF